MDNFKAYKHKLTNQSETDQIVHLANAYYEDIFIILSLYMYINNISSLFTKKYPSLKIVTIQFKMADNV